MGRSEYPRPGEPLAPALLRDILNVPLPVWVAADADVSLRLADLDASAWGRFDEPTCRKLASEIVRRVGRAVRASGGVADRRLPALPAGYHLTDLNLEARTFNCLVAAGFHQRPQDLESTTIDQLLGLRGFWAKGLVDLLTALEHAAQHPQPGRRGDRAVLKSVRPGHRYPRAGQRLAPQTLGEILDAPVPAELAGNTRWAGRRLADLDETVWNDLPCSVVARLGQRIVDRVGASAFNRSVLARNIPQPPRGLRLDDLQLENRTYNCLVREGYGDRLEGLGRKTVGQVLAIKAFGAKSLVDLLTSLESQVAREGQLDRRLTAVAESLAARPEAAEIHVSDPRLGHLLRAMDRQASTLGELVQQVVRRRIDPSDPLRLHDGLCALLEQVEQLGRLSLEDELLAIFSPAISSRDRQIVASYYGWDGGGGHTLETLGRQYGLSRERIRQVCVRAVKRVRGARVFAPVLDRALEFVAGRLPGPLDRIQAEFDAAGFASGSLGLSALAEAARFTGRPSRFAVVALEGRRLVVAPEAADLPRRIVQAARRAVQNYGVAATADILLEVGRGRLASKVDPQFVAETLQTLEPFQWLDARKQWFRLEWLPQYGLPNMIEKVLSVAGRIDGMRLRAAVGRYRRTGRSVPPVGALLEFCRQMPGVRVEGQLVSADPPLDWREVLSGVERAMVEVLLRRGPVLDRGLFEEDCIRNGVNRFSFNAIVMSSPVITQFGRSVYGLVGAKADRKTIQSLSRRRSAQPPLRVLADYGTADDGRFFIAYRLSKAAITGGVITVPAALKERVSGEFVIYLPEGRLTGTLVSKQGCAWGLGPVLRALAARPGDALLLLIDPEKREAELRLGETPAEASAPPQHAEVGV